MAAPGGVGDSKLVKKQVMYNSDDDEGLSIIYKWLRMGMVLKVSTN